MYLWYFVGRTLPKENKVKLMHVYSLMLHWKLSFEDVFHLFSSIEKIIQDLLKLIDFELKRLLMMKIFIKAEDC